MKAQDVANSIGARVTVAGKLEHSEVDRFYAGDRMSDILRQATPTTLLVTRLTGPPLLRAASLMDLPAVCLLNGAALDPALESKAREAGPLIMISLADRAETCRRLNGILEGAVDPP